MYKEYDRGLKPTWCVGCGDFGVLRALEETLAGLQVAPHDVVAVSGIGCSGRISGYVNAYTFHSAHGRALPLAQGVKLARPELTVLALGGDGDGFAIGLNHTLQAARRDVDITYIVMTNNLYGLTKGQTSPLSPKGFVTGSTPHGSLDTPFVPASLMLAAGAGFVAQSSSADQEALKDIMADAIKHKGFAFVNIFSPCVTFNKTHTYQWFKENSRPAVHDSSDLGAAMTAVQDAEGLLTGLIYRRQEGNAARSS
ncbi:MAG TPA: 2-oxoacid:ferredoxin oxidoreductase subunit beta [Bacillota bacterium]|nr:2-oxoacid:ferredoxin oxidoreductase subunit beta [Bacillota bacterium]